VRRSRRASSSQAGRCEPAAPGVVLEHDRAEQAGYRRGGGDRARHRKAREVRAQEVELLLVEREVPAGGHVGGVDLEQRPPGREEIREGGAVEDALVVEIDRELAAVQELAGEAEPAPRPQQLEEEAPLDVLAQEAVLEVVEDPVAVEPVVGGGEAAARHRGDDVHLVEQPLAPPVHDHLGVAELLEHPVGERRGAGPAAREGEEQQHPPGRPLLLDAGRPVAVVGVPALQGLIRGAEAGAARKHERCEQRSCEGASRSSSMPGGPTCPHASIAPVVSFLERGHRRPGVIDPLGSAAARRRASRGSQTCAWALRSEGLWIAEIAQHRGRLRRFGDSTDARTTRRAVLALDARSGDADTARPVRSGGVG
jgi:hypothetical protein